MNSYEFSAPSEERLKTAHNDLFLVLKEALKRSRVDFGIAECHRPTDIQLIYFKEGKSKLDGIKKMSKHNYYPSLAADIYGWVNGKANYETANLIYLAGVIESTAADLYNRKLISHLVRWGGNWDKDGVIITDQTFQDLVHFELYKP